MSDRDEAVREAGLRWWRYAEDDLTVAEQLAQSPEPVFHTICFASQQAVEKALKTALVFVQVDVPRTHEIDLIRDLLPDDWALREAASDVGWLSVWAIAGRYPGNLPEAQAADAERALSSARGIVHIARSDLEKKGLLTWPTGRS